MAGGPRSPHSFAHVLNLAIREEVEAGVTRLRAVADALVGKAMAGDMAAIREVADRLDGKASTGAGGEEGVTIVARIERIILDPKPRA